MGRGRRTGRGNRYFRDGGVRKESEAFPEEVVIRPGLRYAIVENLIYQVTDQNEAKLRQ
jgi:hypothetical protein